MNVVVSHFPLKNFIYKAKCVPLLPLVTKSDRWTPSEAKYFYISAFG